MAGVFTPVLSAADIVFPLTSTGQDNIIFIISEIQGGDRAIVSVRFGSKADGLEGVRY